MITWLVRSNGDCHPDFLDEKTEEVHLHAKVVGPVCASQCLLILGFLFLPESSLRFQPFSCLSGIYVGNRNMYVMLKGGRMQLMNLLESTDVREDIVTLV